MYFIRRGLFDEKSKEQENVGRQNGITVKLKIHYNILD